MAAITAALVKQLRDQTGAGMMDCKGALTATDGDFEAAVDWLRKKGLAAAAKKAGRVASQGLVGVAVSGRRGAMVDAREDRHALPYDDGLEPLDRLDCAVAARQDAQSLRTHSPASVNAVC